MNLTLLNSTLAVVKLLVATVAVMSCATVQAQAYPTKPIRILVHVPSGSAPDITARVVGEKLAESLGQAVVIDNRPGAGGNIAADIVAKSTPDGYTLALCVDSQLVINPHVFNKMAFDPLKDLVPVATLASNEFFLLANPEAPFKTFSEFIEYSKKVNPPLNYASGGNGSQHQLTMEMLKARAGIKMIHIPYKGAGPATLAMISGEVMVGFAGSSASPHIKAGKLKALAVAGKKRSSAFPEIPTIAEFYPGFSNSIWLGLCAPRGTPESVLFKLRTEINKALVSTEVQEKFARGGALEPMVTTPEEFSAMIKADYERYGKVVKDIGVKLD
jgi:tripartite-type tricarboxylate transporter receptor subunit TctC